MKAATLHGYDEALTAPEFVTYEDVDDPAIGRPTDVIVRIGGAGVCRTDLHIVEGVWKGFVDLAFPHIMGHENAGWVEEVGSGVESVKVGDPVICHPLVTSGHCLACRRGNDMHAAESSFPGINAPGGYADYLLTGERALIKLPESLAPKDVAPYTDAGLTAYRVAKKAASHLVPGEYAVIIGAGGLGHIGIQSLAALAAAEIVVVDGSDLALGLAKECGAHHVVKAGDGAVDEVMSLTGGHGAEAVIDFVGEGDAIDKGLAMTRNGGFYYIVGYGGRIQIPAIDMIVSEKTIVGNLVGTYAELVELMALADRGLVTLATREVRARRRQPGAARPARRHGQGPRGADPLTGRQPGAARTWERPSPRASRRRAGRGACAAPSACRAGPAASTSSTPSQARASTSCSPTARPRPR